MPGLIPLGIPRTIASAQRRKAKFVDLDENSLSADALSSQIDVNGKIKRTQIITLWPVDGKPGWWHVKYRADDGSIVYADVPSGDID
jgi:hypothetical protein